MHIGLLIHRHLHLLLHAARSPPHQIETTVLLDSRHQKLVKLQYKTHRLMVTPIEDSHQPRLFEKRA